MLSARRFPAFALKWFSCLVLFVALGDQAEARATARHEATFKFEAHRGGGRAQRWRGRGDDREGTSNTTAATTSNASNTSNTSNASNTTTAATTNRTTSNTTAASKAATSAAATTTTAAPTPDPNNDILMIMSRFQLIEQQIQFLQKKATKLDTVVQQVENIGKETMKRANVTQKELSESFNKTAKNPSMIQGLKNQTKQAALKIKGVLTDMKGLIAAVTKIEAATKSEDTVATKTAMEEAELNNKINKLFPGVGVESFSLTPRINAVDKTIKMLQEKESKGKLGALVEKSLRGHFKSSSDTLGTIENEIAAKNNAAAGLPNGFR